MTDRQDPPAEPDSAFAPDFTPAERRLRGDGWTPERQHDFIEALAASGCVTEACGAVGLSPSSAYRLRASPGANTFRQAWDIALDYAIRRLSDAALSRAINGVARPIFYQGEQVGERRYYDERLTQFMLRYRDPVRYGRWLDHYQARRHPDGAGIALARALNEVTDAAYEEIFPIEDNETGEEGGDGHDSEENDVGADAADATPRDPTSSIPVGYRGRIQSAANFDVDDPAPPADYIFIGDRIRWALRQETLRQERERTAQDAADPFEDDRQSALIIHRPIRAHAADEPW